MLIDTDVGDEPAKLGYRRWHLMATHFWEHLHIPLGAVDACRWDNTASFVVFNKHPVPSLAVACCFPVPREVKGTPLMQYGNVKSPGFFFLWRLPH